MVDITGPAIVSTKKQKKIETWKLPKETEGTFKKNSAISSCKNLQLLKLHWKYKHNTHDMNLELNRIWPAICTEISFWNRKISSCAVSAPKNLVLAIWCLPRISAWGVGIFLKCWQKHWAQKLIAFVPWKFSYLTLSVLVVLTGLILAEKLYFSLTITNWNGVPLYTWKSHSLHPWISYGVNGSLRMFLPKHETNTHNRCCQKK